MSVGSDQERVAALLLLTLRGTPRIYYGDEIGMNNVPIAPNQVRDPFERKVPRLGLGRDGCRTPMQWDAGSCAGFCNTEPWLPLEPSYSRCNVAEQKQNPTSIYNLYRKLISLRRTHPALTLGTYHRVTTAGNLLVYIRRHHSERLLVALNMDAEAVEFSTGGSKLQGRLLLSSFDDRHGSAMNGTIALRGGEGVICKLDA